MASQPFENAGARAPQPLENAGPRAPQPLERAGPRAPRSEPMQQSGEELVKPHGIQDPRDRFSIPSNELRKEKKAELDKLDEEAAQDKNDKELEIITRGAKGIIDYNKK